jgi:hypothetical protein
MSDRKWKLESLEWQAFRRGRTLEALQPYRDGHMFVCIWLRARGFTYAAVGRAVGVSGDRAKQMIDRGGRMAARTNILAQQKPLKHK